MKRDPNETVKLITKTGTDLSREFWYMVLDRFFRDDHTEINVGIFTATMISFVGQACVMYKDMYEDGGQKRKRQMRGIDKDDDEDNNRMEPAIHDIEVILMTKIIDALKDMRDLTEARAREKMK